MSCQFHDHVILHGRKAKESDAMSDGNETQIIPKLPTDTHEKLLQANSRIVADTERSVFIQSNL